MSTILGIDYGHKKIGFAVGQTITGNCRPLTVILQNGEMWKAIDKLFRDWQPTAIVVGKPLLADGKEHPLEKPILQFIEKLTNQYKVSVYRVNEAYTSFEASQRMSQNEGDTYGKAVDAYAAAVMLESYMQE